MPVNRDADGGDTTCTYTIGSSIPNCTREILTGLDSISMTNVPAQDDRLWAHLISAYLFVAVTLFFLGRFYQLVSQSSESVPRCSPVLVYLYSTYTPRTKYGFHFLKKQMNMDFIL